MHTLTAVGDVLGPIASILVFISALIGIPITIVKVRKYLLGASDASNRAEEQSKQAVAQSAQAAKTSHETGNEVYELRRSLEVVVEALQSVTASFDGSRKQHDDLFAAYLRTQNGAERVRLLEHGLAELETDVHDVKTRLMSRTGAAHVDP